MINEELLGRWSHLKNSVQHYWNNFSTRKIKAKRAIKPEDIHIDNYRYESHRIDDMPLTITKDPGPGVKYSFTENSEFARGADKVAAHGIDSFGEEDTFDPDEADEHQDFRNRKQNSDLSQRYHSPGLK